MVDVASQKQPLLLSVYCSTLEAELTAPRRMGRAAIAPNVKMVLIRTLGDLGSDLKIWCISGNFPYLSGLSVLPTGTPWSVFTFRVKISELYPVEEPKDAITRLAETLESLFRNCVGRSFCVCALSGFVPHCPWSANIPDRPSPSQTP